MSRLASLRRRAVSAQKFARSERRIRSAVEAMESRVMLSTYTVNTLLDQVDPISSTTISLRDAISRADAAGGSNTVDVPAGDYKLIGELDIHADSSSLTIQSIGGMATLDAQSMSTVVLQNDSTLDSSVTLSGFVFTGAAYLADSPQAAIINVSVLTLFNSVISGNAGAGVNTGDESTTTLSGVTISNNKSGIDASQGNDDLTVIDSTISGNQGFGVSAGTVGGLKLYDSTVSNNQGYGVYLSVAAYVVIGNSIVAGNSGPADVSQLTTSVGGNVIGVIGNSTGWLASDKTGTADNPLDAKIAPLGNYGGTTQTMPPLAGSPAISGGVASAIPAGVTTDQRGLPRVVGVVDSGAVEIRGSAKIQITPPSAQTFTVAGGSVNLGSFTAPGASGPFVAEINWSDGSPDTVLNLSSAGPIPAQIHKFMAAGVLDVSESVTDSAGDLSNAATFNATVVAHAPTSFIVNTTKDQTDSLSSAIVSLRDAINRADQATGPVNISFSPTVFATGQTLTIQQQGLAIEGNFYGTISISGPAAGLTLNFGEIGNLGLGNHAAAVLKNLNLVATIFNSGTMTLTGCVVDGGGIVSSNALVINDCTITGNTSGAPGSTSDGVENTGQTAIADSTITANYGYGIANAPNAKLTLANSIVAGTIPSDGRSTGDVSGVITSLGHNLIGEKTDSSGWIASDLTGTFAHPLNPKLSLLGDYGGPTPTQYPLPGSVALGAGSVALIPSGVTTDQRGFSRTFGGKVDIGAFQTESTTAITFAPPATQNVIIEVPTKVALGSVSDSGGPGSFLVTLNWGDGSPLVVYTVKSAGALGTTTHAFINTGNLTASLTFVDSAGNLKVGTLLFNSAPLALKTIVVNTIKDTTDPAASTTVSLRDAINRADASLGPVNITFSPTVFATAQTIKLASSIPDLKNNHFGVIDLIGPAAGVTIFSHTTYFQGPHGEQYPTGNTFTVDAGVTASFSDMMFKELGFANSGSITLIDTTITGNMVIGNGAGIVNYGTVKVLDSTISGNYAQADESPGGNFGGYGGGIENDGTLTIINSTISGNTADYRGAGIDNTGTATILDSTISGNESYLGGGIYNPLPSGSSHPNVMLANTIVAGNEANGSIDVFGAFVSSGHNLIGAKNGSAGWTSTDLTGTDAHPLNANLSPLANNGGPTQTMIPLPGSPALGAGSVSLIPTGVTTDQRGLARIVLGKVDIGSVEIQHRTPYFGSPAPFTTIQAENFDKGGQGAAYYNPGDVNEGGVYRPSEGVGIGPIPAADGGGYAVGYTRTGEFLDYTVSVAATATYTINFRVSSQLVGGKFHLDVDGVNVTGTLSVPSTGSFNTYVIVSKTGVHLTAGTHLLTLVIDAKSTAYSGAGNFDWIQAVKTA